MVRMPRPAHALRNRGRAAAQALLCSGRLVPCFSMSHLTSRRRCFLRQQSAPPPLLPVGAVAALRHLRHNPELHPETCLARPQTRPLPTNQFFVGFQVTNEPQVTRISFKGERAMPEALKLRV